MIIVGLDGWQSISPSDMDFIETEFSESKRSATLVFAEERARRMIVYRSLLDSWLERKEVFTNMGINADGNTALIRGSEFRMKK